MNTIFAMRRPFQACTLALAASFAGQAGAAEPVALAPEQIGKPVIAGVEQLFAAAPAPRQENHTLSIGGQQVEAVDLGTLEHQRGREDTVRQDTKLNGDVANNSAINVQTGSNSIDTGSFANMSGIPVVIQNSGANVLIQNATVINLQFQ
ncbi:hypothetical protein [Massilia sp. Mn16-1_5]|uniref:hypothetical protein n=1 Tax=Massilia sp. Mn16-1_5 TaxID=2079199 RepID=UPI00109E44EB|nr:hypothetical protein [Massilia sp. Mn16-1_5]THC39466.1 hypothetical protein C2862_23775 [Massilia sp. Mn16-1_5]